MIFEWDPKKARRDLRDHRVAFEEAATVFRDPLAVTYPDPDHSNEEERLKGALISYLRGPRPEEIERGYFTGSPRVLVDALGPGTLPPIKARLYL